MSYSQHSTPGYGRGTPRHSSSQSLGSFRSQTPERPTESYDAQDMDLGDDDLFSYKPRHSANRLTAHVAPVNADRRQEDRPSDMYYNEDTKSRYDAQSSNDFRRPPTSSLRFADDDYYSSSSRYDRDFDTTPNISDSGLLGDLLPTFSGGRGVPIKAEPEFRARGTPARNPSPDRKEPVMTHPASDYRDYESVGQRPGYGMAPRSSQANMRYPRSDAAPNDFRPRNDFRSERYKREDFRGERNQTFDRSSYPPKGINRQEEVKPQVAVYELKKIPKKDKPEDDPNERPEDKVVKLRMEHATLELQIQRLVAAVESAQERDIKIRANSTGSALNDNGKFTDNLKFLSDAKRKLEATRNEYNQIDQKIKKLLEKPGDKVDKAAENAKEPLQILSTDFLDSKREETEENETSKLEFYDAGDHWCQQCNVFTADIKEFLVHLHSEDHWSKNKPDAVPLWPLVRRATNFDPDRSLAAFKGTQFLAPCRGFYCALCKEFLGDSVAAEEHLFSIKHNKMCQRFFISKPEYEHIFNKDRLSAKSKAEAEARKQKRDAEDRRIREEEARKKAKEEENKKREMEIRERLLEKKKHEERLREQDEKRERERLRKDRDRQRDRDRERDKKIKRKNRIIENLSSDEEVVSSDSENSKPSEDLKLKTPCFVEIREDESEKALQVFKNGKNSFIYASNIWTASSWKADATWTQVPYKKSSSQASTKTVVNADFSDNSNEEFSLATVAAAEEPGAPDNPVEKIKRELDSPDRLQIVESGSPNKTPKSNAIAGGNPASVISEHSDSPIESLIMSALSDCLTPPVVAPDDDESREPPLKKPKKNREKVVEVITANDPDDDDRNSDDAEMDTTPNDMDDAAQFPSLSLDDLVAKSP